MVFDIELTPTTDEQYRARVLLLPEIVIEAPSRTEALDQVRAALRARQTAGAEIVQVAIEDGAGQPGERAWRRNAGAFPDDEAYQQMLAAIAHERQALDAEQDG